MTVALYDFFLNLFTGSFTYESFLFKFNEASSIELFGVNVKFFQYLSVLCTLISLIFIVILCCLFVFKIIKLIGGLIR